MARPIRLVALGIVVLAGVATGLWLAAPGGPTTSPAAPPVSSAPPTRPDPALRPAGPERPGATAEAARSAAPGPEVEPSQEASAAAGDAEDRTVPLEKLLTLTGPLAPPDPLVAGRRSGDAEGEDDGGRLRLRHRREQSAMGSERVAEDELGVLLTLDEARSLGVHGGVRLEREHSARSAEEREAGAVLGIEKRF